jgi:hypothetical protein
VADASVAATGGNQRSKAAMAAGAGFAGTLANTGGAAGLVIGADQTSSKSLLGD